MAARMLHSGCWRRVLPALFALLCFARTALGHPGCAGPSCAPPGKSVHYGVGASDKPAAPEPYDGQKVCLVSGDRLGDRGPAVPVEVETKVLQSPNLLQRAMPRLFPVRPRKLTVYACCPQCAAEVKRDPDGYVFRLIEARGGLTK